jgi:hypothetical protein
MQPVLPAVYVRFDPKATYIRRCRKSDSAEPCHLMQIVLQNDRANAESE